MKSSQTLNNLKGEVQFREKLARQHVSGEHVLPEYFSKEENDRSLLEKMAQTRRQLRELADQGASFKLAVEFGAERGQRSLVLENEFDGHAIALDISFHQLRTVSHYSAQFKMPNIPLCVCCDANRPPLKAGVFTLAFCYEFLHHFPSPTPIVQCILKALQPGGRFLFADEPVKRMKLSLYRQRHKSSSAAYRSRNKVLRYIEKFISEANCDEREYGIMENDEIAPGEWIRALEGFSSRDVFLSSLGGRWTTRLHSPQWGLRHLPHSLLGGLIRGVAQKAPGPAGIAHDLDPQDALTCPECAPLSPESAPAGLQPDLVPNQDTYRCSACHRIFPVVDGVVMLLSDALFQELYPDLDTSRRKATQES